MDSVVYGAYEPGQPDAQVFELTPFVTLFDWATAVDAYTRSGDTRLLADRLRTGMSVAPTRQGTDATATQPLEAAADALQAFGDALDLARPRQALDQASEVIRCLDAAKDGLEGAQALTPFTLLIDNIRQQLDDFAMPMDVHEDTAQFHIFLARQLELVEQLLAWRRFHATALILGEWLTSYWVYYEDRKFPKDILTDYKLRKLPIGQNGKLKLRDRTAPDLKTIADAWDILRPPTTNDGHSNLRNEMAHASPLAPSH